MHTAILLEWHYLIFLVPFGVAALLLLLTTFGFSRSAGHHGHAHGHGHVHAHGHRHAPAQHREGGPDLLGARYLSFPMALQAFFVSFGFCGYWANRLLLQTERPSLLQMLPSLGIALLGGLLGLRGASFIMRRVLPRDESLVVSRQELYGATGKIAFPVSETAGRIHIYDDHGTLHDEMCRVKKGQSPIEKGRHAMVVDVDEDGRLIVERTPDPT